MATRTLPTPTQALRTTWRKLRTMRAAIILLLLLAAGAAVGSFLPQRPIQPTVVGEWIRANPNWAPIVERLGLFDVYGSWWFMGIYVLILVSLVGCLVPRFKAFWRVVRAHPRTTASLSAHAWYRTGTVALDPEAALSGAERVLRERRFRLARANGTLAAEKGHLREGGSLIFHSAFLVLLIGMSVGKLFGHTGQVAVVEGERFRDTRIEYDSISEGRFFRGHRGFTLALDDFDVAWYPNGTARDFVSRVRLSDGDRPVRTEEIRVNEPLSYGGVNVYQLSWGWAPILKVAQHERVLFDGPTVFLPREGAWVGVVKTPGTERFEMGLEMLFFTDPRIAEDGTPFNVSNDPVNPLIVFQQYLGDLGLDRPQSVYTLDKRALAPAEAGAMRMGDVQELPDGISIEFTGVRQYSVFQVASNPGAPVLLAAAVLILVGLIPALYSSRRRVWVRAATDGGVARLEIAGQALQRKAAFEEEFGALLRDLDRDLHERIGARDG